MKLLVQAARLKPGDRLVYAGGVEVVVRVQPSTQKGKVVLTFSRKGHYNGRVAVWGSRTLISIHRPCSECKDTGHVTVTVGSQQTQDGYREFEAPCEDCPAGKVWAEKSEEPNG